MKKLTIQQFAQTIRKKYPGKYDSISDNDLVFKWLKKYYADTKYIEPTELAKLGFDLGKGQVKKATDYVKDKVQDYASGDSTVQNIKDKISDVTDGNWMKDVMDRIKQVKSDTQPQQQPSNTPAPEQKKVVPAYSSTFKSKPCDENTFPWTRGCMNNKIGQMNQIYFGDRYGNIYGDDLYYQLRSLGYFAAQGQKDGEITQYIYDGVLKDSLQESDNFERKKIVKETVKNVLKERLKNN